MTFKGAQQDTARWIAQFKDGYWPPADQIVCLTEEVGELAREVNHRFGPKPRKPTEAQGDMGEEMADIVFILCCLANQQGIDLDEAWERHMRKLDVRDGKRFERK
jgi:NTP pyrophosphatase (non-canonical NTP hydrolase)